MQIPILGGDCTVGGTQVKYYEKAVKMLVEIFLNISKYFFCFEKAVQMLVHIFADADVLPYIHIPV